MKKVLTDFTYYIGSAKQSSDYDTATEFIINYIKQEFDHGADIGKALKQLEEIDFAEIEPTLGVSKSDDADTKSIENRQFEMKYKEDYAQHKRRVAKYTDNLTKAYALIWGRCSKTLQQKLQQRKDFGKSIEDNPIEVLKAIKHAMSYQENRYPMKIIHDAMKNALDSKKI